MQVRSGNITRIVEIFPLQVRNDDIPEPLGTVKRNDVLEGVVSDNTCLDNPCINGGNCTVTWNDFLCICPPGFKGKTCHENEFCAIYECPTGGVCQNLNDGYECVTSATFNGVNSSISYTSSGIRPDSSIPATIEISYRSKGRGGTILTLQNEDSLIRYIRVDVASNGVITRWITRGGLTLQQSIVDVVNPLNGEWHTVQLNLSDLMTQNVSISDLVAGGQITLGGSAAHSISERDVDSTDPTVSPSPSSTFSESSDLASSTDAVSTPSTLTPLILPPTVSFRGCLNEVRVGGLLLPFFPPADLINDGSAMKFQVTTPLEDVERQCRLCYDHECQNGASCADPLANYTCNCLPGFEGDLCEINIDECLDNKCVNGACVDGIANYTCDCQLGWTGWL